MTELQRHNYVIYEKHVTSWTWMLPVIIEYSSVNKAASLFAHIQKEPNDNSTNKISLGYYSGPAFCYL